MSTRNLPRGKGLPALKADLTAICEPTLWKMWEQDSGIALLFLIHYIY
jgi:hypothetical protein